MRNVKLLLALVALNVISSCSINNDNNSLSTTSEMQSNSIVIEYCYKDGTCFEKVEMKGNVNQEYTFESPSVSFMIPEVEIINFKLTNKGYYQKVVYDYSNLAIEEFNKNEQTTPFMASEEYGLSISYIHLQQSTINQSIIKSDTLKIYPDGFGYGYFKFSTLNAIKYNNVTSEETKLEVNDSMYITLSFNKDYSIDLYKNGAMCYSWLSSMLPDNSYDPNHILKNYIVDIFNSIEEKGITVLNSNNIVKNLVIGQAVNKEEAYELYNNNVHTKIKYVDEFGNEIFSDKNIIDNGGTTYEYISPALDNYKVDKEKVSGITSVNKEEKVTYTFDAEELITREMKAYNNNILNHKNEINWETQNWFNLSKEISGNFILRTNYHLNGIASNSTTLASDCCYRTNLIIVEDSTTKDRFVSRLDWWGWQDDLNRDGKLLGDWFNAGFDYLNNYNQDIYNVYSNCDITQTITRNGSTLTIDFIIVPKNYGYENKVYYHTVSLYGITSSKLNINVAAEDAIVTFNSNKLKNIY